MKKLETYLIATLVLAVAIVLIGPSVVALLKASVPVVLAVGLVLIVGRIVWYFTTRW